MPQPTPSHPIGGLTLRRAALITGLAYLLNPVTFAEAYLMPRLVVADPAQTAANLSAHPHPFAAAILSYTVSALGDIVIAWALYILHIPANRALALLGSLLQLGYAAAWLAAIANLGLLFRLTSIPGCARHITPADLPLQTTLLLGAFHSG